MRDPCDELDDAAEAAPAVASHGPATQASRIPAPLREADLMQKMFWNIGEVAFMCRVSARTVWRELSNPKSKFPRPSRIRGRAVFARDEVLAHMAKEATR